jgi:tetratricopeptide (TPR) repeat protein
MALGGDPRPALERAIAAYGESLRLNPTNVYTYNNRAGVLQVKALYLDDIGLDPDATLTEALADLTKAIEINPRFPSAYRNKGDVHCVQAQHALRRGADPSPFVVQAREALATACALKQRYAGAYGTLAAVHAAAAEFDLRSGRDATTAAVAGLAAASKALEAGAPDVDVFVVQARLLVLRARGEMRVRRRPASFFDQARTSLGRALAMSGNEPRVRIAVAELCRWQAEAALAAGDRSGAAARVEEGLAAAATALAANSALVRALDAKRELETLKSQPALRSVSIFR